MSRIVVKVDQNPHSLLWRAVCHTEQSNGQPCTWTSQAQVVKTAATEEARWHRDYHRKGAGAS
jgi:hypothetical protein